MDAERFDNRVRGRQFASSRRGVARTFAGLSLSGVLGTLSRFTDAAARKKRKRKKKC